MIVVNNSLFKSGGRIGRKGFVVSVLKVHAISLVTMLIITLPVKHLLLLFASEALTLSVIQKLALGYLFYAGYLSVRVCFKRLRDIYHYRTPSKWWVLALLSPVSGFIFLWLALKKGRLARGLVE